MITKLKPPKPTSKLLILDRLQLSFERHVTPHYPRKSNFLNIRNSDFLSFEGGRLILSSFDGSSHYLLALYPHLPWTVLDVPCVPHAYWDDLPNAKLYLDFLSHKLPDPILRFPDWKHFHVTLTRNPEHADFPHLRHLLKKTKYSVYRLFEFLLPEYFWNKLFRAYTGKESPDEIRMLMDAFLLERAGVRKREDLVKIGKRVMFNFPGGHAILRANRYSPQEIFEKIYEEFTHRYEKKVYKGYWKNAKVNYLLQNTMKCYCLRRREDWYRLSIQQISEVYGKRVNRRRVIELLEFWYPEEMWSYERFSERLNKRAVQRLLGLRLREVFGEEVVFEDYVLRGEGGNVLLDYYFPRMGLVVEYQGEQHYFRVLRWASMEEQVKRDKVKRRICEEKGLYLVNVPYWWDGSKEFLKEIIFKSTQINGIELAQVPQDASILSQDGIAT